MEPKYQIGQDCILCGDNPLGIDTEGTWKIYEVYFEPILSKYRYKLRGLWFEEDEFIVISREDNPEYYL